MNEKDCAQISEKSNFLHILKQKLKKSDFRFLIKKGRVNWSPEFSVGMHLN